MSQPHYRVIHDQAALEAFVKWLPELTTHEKFYVSLFARRKYDDRLKGAEKASLRRFLSDKERLIYKIRQLELPRGRYVNKEIEVSDHSIALYITPNPRCMRKATFGLVRQLMNRLENKNQAFNPHSDALTMAHKAKSRTVWVDFDIDLEIEDMGKPQQIQHCMEVINAIVGEEAVTYVETRGGLHCLVEPGKVSGEKHWHQQITRSLTVDQQGDLLMPVPGCCQGGFVPTMI